MSMAPNRLLRLWRARLGIRGRLRAITSELRTHFPQLDRLVASSHIGGFDSIYFLHDRSGAFGVLRLNNPRLKPKVVHSDLPRISLNAQERLTREWEAYTTLGPIGLSPKTLWRTRDAVACSYSESPRFRELIEQRHPDLTAQLVAILNAIGQMHAAGIVHLDLSPGNVLIDPRTGRVELIDFEYGVVPGRSFAENCRFDWLRFLELTRKRAEINGFGSAMAVTLERAISASNHADRIPAATVRAA